MRLSILFCFLLFVPISAWSEPLFNRCDTPRIPDEAIASLQRDWAEFTQAQSTTQARRAAKNVIRGAESLLEKYPESDDRYHVLGIVFQTQRMLFAMRQTAENQAAMIETAERLMPAPDAYAAHRVEAHMLLLQVKIADETLSPQDQALAIARFADRYRETSAEAKSLMMAASVTFDLGNAILLKALRERLETGFRHDPEVNTFLRQRFALGSDVFLPGTYARGDGKQFSFPIGQVYVVCFWSMQAPLLKEQVAEVKALQERYKGDLKIYSFNLDELRDAGTLALKRMGADWVPLELPGGVNHPVYQSIGGAGDFSVLVIDAHGLARTADTGRDVGALHKRYEAAQRQAQHAPLLRSLCIGDHFVADLLAWENPTVPPEALQAIRACFPPRDNRVGLSLKESRATYERANQLCAQLLEKHPDDQNRWRIHDTQTIALLGLWRLSGEMAYLERAASTAQDSLRIDVPARSRVVPHLSIATHAMVANNEELDDVLSEMIGAAAEDDPLGLVYSSAMLLALEAHSRDTYVQYRDLLLSQASDDPSAWPVSSFLLDISTASVLFEKALPGTHPGPSSIKPEQRRFFREAFKTVHDQPMDFSRGSDQTMHAVVFVDMPADQNAQKFQEAVIAGLVKTAADRPLEDLRIVGLFRSTNHEQLQELLKQQNWAFAAVAVDDTAWDRLSLAYGVVDAQHRPNVLLLHRDGAIGYALSGISPDAARIETVRASMANALREIDLALAEQALATGDFGRVVDRLATSFPLENRRRSRFEPEWLTPSAHRRKLVWAAMQAQDWQRALEAVDINIAIPRQAHSTRNASDQTWCRSCYGPLQPIFIRALLLRQMGDEKQAAEALALIPGLGCERTKDLAPVWKEAERYITSRTDRFNHLRDPKRHLEEYENEIRRNRQDLYQYKLEHDLMMRAEIYEELGRVKEAESDRRYARALAWPFEVTVYDPSHLREAGIRRRELARKHIANQQWQSARDLLTTNIEVHEAEAKRCDAGCKVCGAHVQAFGYRAQTLKELGRDDEAAQSLALASLAKCPLDEVRDQHTYFAVNRMYGGGGGISRINFIHGFMLGENYANPQDRIYRMELAGDLALRATALKQLGEADQADKDLSRANALAYPYGARAALASGGSVARYVDLLSTVGE